MARGDKKLEMFADHVKLKLHNQLPDYETVPGKLVEKEILGIVEDWIDADVNGENMLTTEQLKELVQETFERGWSAAVDAARQDVDATHTKYNK